MQPRSAAILFLVAVALGAFVYLYEIQGEAGREAEETQSRRLFPEIEPEQVAFLAFRTQDDQAFEGLREGEGWLIQSPVVFPGDEVTLDAIASTLANLRGEATIDDPGAPEIYGLGEAARWIRFRVGSETYALGIGAETPVGGNVYVSRQGDEAIHTVPSFRVSSFERELSALRDRRVLDFDRTRVNRIVVGWAEGSVTLERGEAGWSIRHPLEAVGPADESTVDSLLSDTAFLRAEDFVDDESVAADSEAYLTLRLGLEAAEGEPLEIGLRAVADPSSDDFLVRGDHSATLYRVPRARLVEFPRDVFDYRFKQLTDFEVAGTQAIEVVLQADARESSVEPVRHRVARTESGWKADGEAWKPGKAAGLVAELAKLEAVSVVAEQADDDALAKLGLAPPRVLLRAFGAEQDGEAPLLAEVALGSVDASSGIVAHATDQQTIFRIDAALADSIPTDLASFRAEFLAPPNTAAAPTKD